MTQPTAYPDWATADSVDPILGQPNKVAPTGALVSTGWATGNQPPANIVNYQLNLIGLWIRYLSTVTAQVSTLTATVSDGTPAVLVPNAPACFMAFGANAAGSVGIAVGYQSSLSSAPTLNSAFGSLTWSTAAGGVISAIDPANPTSPVIVHVLS